MTPQKKRVLRVRVEGCDIMIILKYIRFRINPWCESTEFLFGLLILGYKLYVLRTNEVILISTLHIHTTNRKKKKR
jgi:hypothetical protein